MGGRGPFLINKEIEWFFMILTREINIKINESNYQYYDDLGYDVTIGEEIVIPIELMSKGSHYKINCQCDGCGELDISDWCPDGA